MTALNDTWVLDPSGVSVVGGDGHAQAGGHGRGAGSGSYGSESGHGHSQGQHGHRGNGPQGGNGEDAEPVVPIRFMEMQTSYKKPGARGYHTANVVGNVMIVVGGSDGKECFGDVWCLNLDTLIWSQIKLPDALSYKRLSHSATQVGSCLFVIGGHDGAEYTSEVLPFNLVSLTYESRPLPSPLPPSRGYHACVLADSRIFLFGGYNGGSVFKGGEVWMLELAAAAYLPQVTSFYVDV